MKCPGSTRRESTVIDETEKSNSALEGRRSGKGPGSDIRALFQKMSKHWLAKKLEEGIQALEQDRTEPHTHGGAGGARDGWRLLHVWHGEEEQECMPYGLLIDRV